jgi:hypothetical protein
VTEGVVSTKRPPRRAASASLFDDFDDTARSRLDQNRAAIYDRVAILADAIFRRHVIIGHAVFRKDCANPHILPILIRGAPLFNHIGAKAGTLIDAKDTVYAANDSADDATYDCTDRPCRSLTVPRTALDASGDTLSLARNGEQDRDSNSDNSDKTADHDNSFDGDWEGPSTKADKRFLRIATCGAVVRTGRVCG